MKRLDLVKVLESIILELKESQEEDIQLWAYDETDKDWIGLEGKLKLTNKIIDIK